MSLQTDSLAVANRFVALQLTLEILEQTNLGSTKDEILDIFVDCLETVSDGKRPIQNNS